jgi:hypothetical protein
MLRADHEKKFLWKVRNESFVPYQDQDRQATPSCGHRLQKGAVKVLVLVVIIQMEPVMMMDRLSCLQKNLADRTPCYFLMLHCTVCFCHFVKALVFLHMMILTDIFSHATNQILFGKESNHLTIIIREVKEQKSFPIFSGMQ